MLKRKLRLQWKDVRFLTRKRQVFSNGIFTIFYIEQYPNRQYHQISYLVPLAVSKRAVVRHKVKRILIAEHEKSLSSYDFWWKWYKCFVSMNKSKLAQLLAILEKKDSTQLKNYLESEHKKTFSSFVQFLWKK